MDTKKSFDLGTNFITGLSNPFLTIRCIRYQTALSRLIPILTQALPSAFLFLLC